MQNEVKTICFHHEQLLQNVFERKAEKCCGTLKTHRRSAKSKQTIDLEMAKNLKCKSYNVVPGQKLCRHCVVEYHRIMSEIEWEDSINPNDDPMVGNESFHEYETPRKRVNSSLESIGLSPINFRAISEEKRSKKHKKS